jgi:hypothetical protein
MQSRQPIDIATCIDFIGLDPLTGEEVYPNRNDRAIVPAASRCGEGPAGDPHSTVPNF